MNDQTEFMDNLHWKIAKGIKALREQDGMSQSKLARKCNMAVETLQKWEQGKNAPSHEKLMYLLHCTKWTYKELLRGQKDGNA